MADDLFIGPYQPTDYSYGSSTQIDDLGLPKPSFIASNESGTGYTTYFADNVPEYLQPKGSSFFSGIADTVSGWADGAGDLVSGWYDSASDLASKGWATLGNKWDYLRDKVEYNVWGTRDAIKERIRPVENKYADVIDRAFNDCPKPSVFGGWVDSLNMFFDWIGGVGPDYRAFGHCSQQSQDMANAWAIGRARDDYYNQHSGKPFEEWPVGDRYRGRFDIPGAIRAGIDPTEQFVGSYRLDIFPQKDRTLRFEVTNNTSMTSFLYGLGPSWERDTFEPGGNMKQKYVWQEPLK